MRVSSPTERTLLFTAASFLICGAVSLALQTGSAMAIIAVVALLATAAMLNAWLERAAPGHDPLILPITILLTGWGLLILTRVAPNFVYRQIGSLGVAALTLALVTARHSWLRYLKRFKYTWLIAGFALLSATLLFGVNPSGFGARLWLRIGSVFLQPSELLRLLLIAFWSAFLAERAVITPTPDRLLNQTLLSFLPAIVMWLIAVGLLATQQDLGAASLLLLTFAFMLYLATGRRRVPLALVIAFAAAGVVGYQLSDRVATRIDIWLNPDIDPQGASFQVVQSLIAIGSGGLFGQGLNQGRPDYVPAVHTDFPFVVVAEEFGWIGATAFLSVFALLCLRIWRVALRTASLYVRLLAGGIAASLAVQLAVILGGNLALAPLTGVTVPFVSFGGSSLLVWYVSAGLVLRLSADHDMAGRQFGPLDQRPSDLRTPQRAVLISMSLLALVFASLCITMLVRGPSLYARADNPRLVDDERAIVRGAILDRDGAPLALSAPIMQVDGRPVFSRTYLAPWAASAVGYYSLRYGVGGIEAHADARLRGNQTLVDRLLHRAQVGAAVRTTLDPLMQRHLHGALQGQTGGAIVMDWRTGEVLALVSSPGFDPNDLDRDWDRLRTDARAPLVNRVTQGLYQPGALLAWLYDATPDTLSWDASDRFGLGRPSPFELQNLAVPYPVSATISETLGQGELRVTPLQVAVAAAQRTAAVAPQPTLLMERSNAPAGQIRPVSYASFETVAENGPGRYVAWRVLVDERRVIVIALEQADSALDRARAISVP